MRRLETSRESELTTDIHTVVNNIFTHFAVDELTKEVLPKNMSSIASSYFESSVDNKLMLRNFCQSLAIGLGSK